MDIKTSITRDGKVIVHCDAAAPHHVGFIYREPGSRWGSMTRHGRIVTRAMWTRAEAADALVRRYYH